jgi:prepilin-type N-terminal cleavage/methylation domain-containing protein
MEYSLQNNKGMTFVEMLVVMGIISILFASFFYIWNTMDVFRKSRDSKRINDLQLLDTALKTLLSTERNINLGEENVIYTSLPDSSSTCGSYDLLPLFSPYSYRCQTSQNYLKVDGNGWLPVNFTLGKILTISVLPIDPLNNKDYFYAYQVRYDRYKLTARFESQTNIGKMANDGGLEPTLYEVGSDLFIPSPHSGLVGYWSFDEGTGTIAYDLSGYGNNGTLNNFNFNEASGWTTGKIGKALIFDGSDDYVSLNQQPFLSNGFTFSVWVKIPSLIPSGYTNIFNNNQFYIRKSNSAEGNYWDAFITLSDNSVEPRARGIVAQADVWTHLVVVWDKVMLKIYVNSEPKDNVARTGDLTSTTVTAQLGRGEQTNTLLHPFLGIIDEVRIYDRALSPAEIKALYEATK